MTTCDVSLHHADTEILWGGIPLHCGDGCEGAKHERGDVGRGRDGDGHAAQVECAAEAVREGQAGCCSSTSSTLLTNTKMSSTPIPSRMKGKICMSADD